MGVRLPATIAGILSLLGLGATIALAPGADAAQTRAAAPPPAAPPAAPPPGAAVEPPDDTGFLPGANDFACKPPAEHPRPVVLVHGTFENMTQNWLTMAPALKDEGYCVYAFNYGGKKGDLTQGTGDVATSATQLDSFVDKVLLSSGAKKVDLVGHSQGGMMPRQYLKFLGGAAKVRTLVGISPDNHGTNLDGLSTLATSNDLIGSVVFNVCPACTDQIVDSAFLTKLNDGGDTVPGVRYTVIATEKDEVVTPFQSGFLEGPETQNIVLQDICPDDSTEHIGMPNNKAVLQLTKNALDPKHRKRVPCE